MKGVQRISKTKGCVFPYPNRPTPTLSDPGCLGKLQMDIGENAGSDGEGDGRVDEDG